MKSESLRRKKKIKIKTNQARIFLCLLTGITLNPPHEEKFKNSLNKNTSTIRVELEENKSTGSGVEAGNPLALHEVQVMNVIIAVLGSCLMVSCTILNSEFSLQWRVESWLRQHGNI